MMSRHRLILLLVLLAVLLALAAVGALAAAPPAAAVLPLPAAGFAQAVSPRTFAFPADHGPHAQFRQEWWYVTGNLNGADGARFGFELTFFRFALAPPAEARAATLSAWRTRTIYLAHFAVTDVERAQFHATQKLARAALGLSGATAQPFAVWIEDWSLTGGAEALPWHLHAQQPGYALDLELTAQGAPVLNGIAGLSRKSADPDSSSYYYSVPRLAVQGQLQRDGRTLAVHGSAWLDREWGSGALSAAESGWDWFALQLDDGATLMFYVLRHRDGSRDAYSAGTWVAADGSTRALTAAAVQIDTQAFWRSRHGERYPAAWRLRVPSLALELQVRPVLADQELDTTPRYWEGAVDAVGTRAGQPLRARGYVELVGYAQERAAGAATGAAVAVGR
jgi:predicted secreted hydrolase